MKVVTVYKRKGSDACAYKYKGKVYGFMHSTPSKDVALRVTSGAYRPTPQEHYTYTGKRYVFK